MIQQEFQDILIPLQKLLSDLIKAENPISENVNYEDLSFEEKSNIMQNFKTSLQQWKKMESKYAWRDSIYNEILSCLICLIIFYPLLKYFSGSYQLFDNYSQMVNELINQLSPASESNTIPFKN